MLKNTTFNKTHAIFSFNVTTVSSRIVGVDFTEGGKPENPEKNPRSTGETNYNSTHMSSKFFEINNNLSCIISQAGMASSEFYASIKTRHCKGCFPVMTFFLRTCAQYASMNEFTCSEHSVRIRT